MIDYGNGLIFPDAWGQDPPDDEVFLDDERFDDAEWPGDFEAALDALSRAALAPAPPSRTGPR